MTRDLKHSECNVPTYPLPNAFANQLLISATLIISQTPSPPPVTLPQLLADAEHYATPRPQAPELTQTANV
jgi:hypothetical protein